MLLNSNYENSFWTAQHYKVQSFVVGGVPKKKKSMHSSCCISQLYYRGEAVKRLSQPWPWTWKNIPSFDMYLELLGCRGSKTKPFARPPKGQRSGSQWYTCWDLKESICLIQPQNITLQTNILKHIPAFRLTYSLLSIDFIVLGEERGDTPGSVWAYHSWEKKWV